MGRLNPRSYFRKYRTITRLVSALVFFILISCETGYFKNRDNILFNFSSNIPYERGETISFYITNEIKLTKGVVEKITKIKIDSSYFSIILFIPVDKNANGNTRGQLRQFAKNLSSNYLDNTPVHIIATDDGLNPIGYLPFNPSKLGDLSFHTGTTKITLSDNCEIYWASNIDLIFVDKMPEIYTGKDSVLININALRDVVDIDVEVDPTINLDTLTNQFRRIDPIIFNLTFKRKAVFISIINNETKEAMKGYEIKKLTYTDLTE